MSQAYPGFLTVPSGCRAQKPWEAGCTAVSYGRDWEQTFSPVNSFSDLRTSCRGNCLRLLCLEFASPSPSRSESSYLGG